MAYDLVTGLGGGGGGRVGYDLKDLYQVHELWGGFVSYRGSGTSSDQASAFFSSYHSNFGGAYVSNISTTNSYVTIVNVTSGSGTFLCALSGVLSVNGEITFRITIDGESRTLTSPMEDGYRALCLTDAVRAGYGAGSGWPIQPSSSETSPLTGANAVDDMGWPIAIPQYSSGRDKGIRFETSCKVEILNTTAYTTTDPQDWALAAVWLDQ